MKNISTLILLLSAVILNAQNFSEYSKSISKAEVKAQVYALAATEMMGRNTGEEGQKMAANYMANFFRSHQIDSFGFSNYEQDFDLYDVNIGEAELKYNYHISSKDTTVERTFRAPWIANGEVEIDTILTSLYLGYGTEKYDADYSQNAIILLTNGSLKETHETVHRIHQENNAKVFMIGSDKTPFSGALPSKEELLEAKDTKMPYQALLALDRPHLEKNLPPKKEVLDALAEQLPEGVIVYYMPKWYLSYVMGEKAKDLHKSEAKRIKGKEFEEFEAKIDSFQSNIMAHAPSYEKKETENIVAFIEGTDLKNEVIVVSGHYDHVGAENDTTINYGADDNASGTVAVMQVAAALQKATKDGLRPRRSVLCVAFSGEEVGLRGSDYFVSNCPVNLDSVVLNLNMDMIGRNTGKKADSSIMVYMINQGKHERYVKRLCKGLAKGNDSLKVSTHPGLKERLTWTFSSDHFRFKRKGIPIACFFTGLHDDYHTPRDTPDKINYDKLTEICRLSADMIWVYANSDKKLLSKHKVKNKKNVIEKILD